MSKIGKKSIALPADVECAVEGNTIRVKGPKGVLEWTFPSAVRVVSQGSELKVSVKNAQRKQERALWGLARSLIANMVTGVARGFERKLELVGIGYKAQSGPKGLVLEIGFSHSVEFPLPPGVEYTVEKSIITLRGIDKALVGNTAARIRSLRPPEPYKGKGIRYVGEVVRKKAGKAAKAAGAKTA